MSNVKAFIAIVQQTMRSAIRSKVFHILFVLILLAVFLLPMTVSGDGTAVGLVQISLTYSLGIVVTLISTTTLWLACSQLSHEIEAYNIHLVVSKPCPRWLLWLGKWFGIFAMHSVILLVSAAIVFALIQWRVARGNFSEDEHTRLDKEIRVGRRAFFPDPEQFDTQVDADYERRQDEFAGQDPATVKAELRRQLVAKSGDIQPGHMKNWSFTGVQTKSADDPLFIRYRLFSGSTSSTNQQLMPCLWGLKDPTAAATIADPFVYQQLKVMGGSFQEMPISNLTIDKDNDNRVVLRYINPPVEYWEGAEPTSAVFQAQDGPAILVAVAGFAANYWRAMVLAVLQLAFLAALGCTVSAAFSTPVAAFVAVAYLVIGLSVQAAITAPLQNDDGSWKYKGFSDMAAHKFAQVVGQLVVSVDDLDATSDLARGRLVEGRRIGMAFATLFCLRTGLIAGVGIWILTRRELGTVIRK